jgi:hypothetical protein
MNPIKLAQHFCGADKEIVLDDVNKHIWNPELV